MTSYPIADWHPDISQRTGPVYRAIAAALHDDVVSGRLPPGSRLPTHRDLAWKLKVTVGTITRAYQEAERQGLVGGEVGRGTFVQDPRRLPNAPLEPPPAADIIDLSVNSSAVWPDAPVLRKALAGVAARADLSALMGYNHTNGATRLRRAASVWIEETAALSVPDERVLITAGGQGGLHAAFSTLTRPGDAVLVEQLTYPGVKALASLLGLRLIPVPMDKDGLLPDAVGALAAQHGAHTLYCMPTLQNPTTATMPLERRKALVEVARRIGLTLVEDDVYGFLNPQPLATLAEIGPDVTVYVTSLSKSLFPGLRTGFIVPPEPLWERTATMLRASLLSTAHLGTIAAAELIESGEAGGIAARRRALVAERQGLARRVLGQEPAGSDPRITHLWLTLPEAWRREEFARELMARRIKVTPADAFTVARGDTPHAVRICLCSVDREDQLESALHVVANLLTEPTAVMTTLV